MFVAPFAAPFPSPVASSGAATTPWYLAGGVALANVVAAYQPIGAASLAASYSNLANPGTNDAAPGVAPTWASATGWTFNGTTQYLATGSGLLHGLRDFSIIYRVDLDGAAKRGVFSCGGAGASDLVFIEHDRHFVRISGVSVSLSVTVSGVCVGALTHDASATLVYKDAVRVASGSGHAVALNVAGLQTRVVGVFEGSGAGAYYMKTSTLAMAVYGVSLAPAQVLAITTAMNALTG